MRTICCFRGECAAALFRQDLHANLLRDVSNTIIETQELESSNGRTGDDNRCDVNRVERPNRISRERLPRALDDVRTNAENMPVSCSGR